ncbi:uncharacterized protein LOC124451541 [Xenia sp. Carnegie-2017]|uniref:uncharacterized protein LOC124451541 n=1 Tax=Xenia sp. Carnegie-2017 TaxID=2897299 RepID=UPI001F035CBD|nr:uncharacterized protein LOC124451541 [Xenia sp. Carnegie-2017]
MSTNAVDSIFKIAQLLWQTVIFSVNRWFIFFLSYMEINAVQGNEKSTGNVSSVTLPPLPGQQTFITADQYFLPFELACQTKCAMIVTIAVDCTQRPLYLTGNNHQTRCVRSFEKARLPEG